MPPVKDGKNATIPGADTSMVYSSLLPRFALEWQHEYCRQYAERGYTDLFLDVQLTIGAGEGQAGMPLDTFIAAAKVAQSYGLDVDVSLVGGPRDATADYYRPTIIPLIDELFAQQAINKACVGMQLDGWNSPYGLKTIIEMVGDRVKWHDPGLPIAIHTINHALAWWGADEHGDSGYYNRFEFWKYWRDRGLLDWGYAQLDVDDPVDALEGHLSDLLACNDIVVSEISAQAQYDEHYTTDQIECDEDHGDLKGLITLCTAGGPFKIRGFGNGARRQDGTAL